MIVAAIDPSVRAAGHAVLAHGKLTLFGRGPLRSASDVNALVEALASYSPDVVALEAGYLGVNARTGLDLAVLRGRLLQALEGRNVRVELVQPSAWRKTIFGKVGRRKRKEWKQAAVAKALELYGVTATDDESEAILIGTSVCIAAAKPVSPQADRAVTTV